MLVVFILIMAIVLAASIRKPLFGLLAMLVALQTEHFFLGSLPAWLTVGRMAGICAMAGWLVNRHRHRPSSLLTNPGLAAPVFLFLAVAIVGSLFALDVSGAISETIRVAMLVLLGIIVAETIHAPRDLQTFFWVLVLSTAVGAAAALLQFNMYQAGEEVTGIYQARGGVRFEGLSDNANVLGIHLLTGVPFLFCLFFASPKGWIRVVCMGLLGVIAFALVLSVSRSNVYPLGVYLLATNLLHRKMGKHLIADNVLVAVAVGMLGLAVLESSEFVWDRLAKPVVAREDESSGAIRMAILRQGPEIMSESPVFGVGLRNNRQYGMNLEAHDTYSALLGETGLFGTAFFIAFCIGVVRHQKGLLARARDSGNPLFTELAVALAGIVCVLIVWTPVKVIYYQRLFWLWAGLVVWLDAQLRFWGAGTVPSGAVPRPSLPRPGWPAPVHPSLLPGFGTPAKPPAEL